ncbi:sirohydrochlorin chelatase [Caryophanon latum]|uniref:Sirohydrochlorin ferrochelatase n=1 Tax=Caryophanon latum TaxID=33977 RepID=A0A1C0YZ70_9BACL|nr:sirohydrochlorin chelatase [Caryophanon latum]OCS92441.1 sirohydrochlorin ferrochelatase [Caryophanon latum]
MEAVLYVAHGTRVQKGIDEAVRFIEAVKQTVAAPIQEICFLELAAPSIVEGVERCVTQGATHIAVVPILLLTANHAKEDIPEELHKAQQLFPTVRFTVGAPFGIHEKLIDSLVDRLAPHAVEQHARIYLIGRGSSDPTPKQDLSRIASLLSERIQRPVDVCFLYGVGPTFEETLQHIQQQNDATPIYIIPYLLFSGLLQHHIEKTIHALQFETANVTLCAPLGYDENVQHVLAQRTDETLQQIKEQIAYG